jgi:membrane-bound lytic murein transglycosylase C
MKKPVTTFLLATGIFWLGMSCCFGDAFDDARARWNQSVQGAQGEWDRMEAAHEEQWERMRKQALQKWQTFVHSTRKDWVVYDAGYDTRSRVDFKEGEIVLETVVPTSDPDPAGTAQKQIAEQARKIFKERDLGTERVLEKQVVTKSGEAVGPKNLEGYLEKEVVPEITPEPGPVPSRDGVRRQTYQVRIKLVPEHIRVRAEKYLPLIKGNAARFHLKPQLILAVIHTESYFNPKAVSSCNAVGMMQIIPRFAGREAYGFVYKTDKLVTPEYLYEPANNIELGSAYLHLLRYRYFKDVKGDVKNRYVAVCGYNWGPTVMRRKVVGKYPLNDMGEEEVFRLLCRVTPDETRHYVKRVRERMPLYDPFF